MSERKTHYFENVVHVEEDRLLMSEDLKEKIAQGYHAGLLKSKVFLNENEIEEELHPMSVPGFFNTLVEDVKAYYGVNKRKAGDADESAAFGDSSVQCQL